MPLELNGFRPLQSSQRYHLDTVHPSFVRFSAGKQIWDSTAGFDSVHWTDIQSSVSLNSKGELEDCSILMQAANPYFPIGADIMQLKGNNRRLPCIRFGTAIISGKFEPKVMVPLNGEIGYVVILPTDVVDPGVAIPLEKFYQAVPLADAQFKDSNKEIFRISRRNHMLRLDLYAGQLRIDFQKGGKRTHGVHGHFTYTTTFPFPLTNAWKSIEESLIAAPQNIQRIHDIIEQFHYSIRLQKLAPDEVKNIQKYLR